MSNDNQIIVMATYNDLYADRLRSVKTEILVALVVAAIDGIGLFIWIYSSLLYVRAGGLGYLSNVEIALESFDLVLKIYFIFIIPSILVFLRICLLYSAAKKGDINKLKRLSSIGWAIMALIFSGVIPGVMLLVARSQTEQFFKTPINSGL